MLSKERSDRVAGGVFLIGLGVLLFTHIVSFWPGILFVIGASLIARDITEEREWRGASAGLGMMALGVIFLVGFNWPLLLILIGLSMVFGHSWKSSMKSKHGDQRYVEVEKSKNDDAPYIMTEKPKHNGKLTTEDFL